MQLHIPLDKMTVAEKMLAIEEIWSDLQKTADEIPCPAWHEDVIHAREARVRDARSQFHDWPDAKERIRG